MLVRTIVITCRRASRAIGLSSKPWIQDAPKSAGEAEIVGSPDAPTNALARLEHRDVVTVNGEVSCGRQSGNAGTDHQDLSRLTTHVFLGDQKLHLTLRSRLASTFSHLTRIKGRILCTSLRTGQPIDSCAHRLLGILVISRKRFSAIQPSVVRDRKSYRSFR